MSEYTLRPPEPACDSRIEDTAQDRNGPLAMAFVRDQRWERPMCAREALNRGTAFRRLVMPFEAAEVCDEKR